MKAVIRQYWDDLPADMKRDVIRNQGIADQLAFAALELEIDVDLETENGQLDRELMADFLIEVLDRDRRQRLPPVAADGSDQDDNNRDPDNLDEEEEQEDEDAGADGDDSGVDDDKRQCPDCGKWFNKHGLGPHKRHCDGEEADEDPDEEEETQADEDAVACLDCGATFETRVQLSGHVNTGSTDCQWYESDDGPATDGGDVEEEDGEHTCPGCGETFTTERGMKIHRSNTVCFDDLENGDARLEEEAAESFLNALDQDDGEERIQPTDDGEATDASVVSDGGDDTPDDVVLETAKDHVRGFRETVDRVDWSDYSAPAGNGTQCQNCGTHLTPDFTRVFEPEDEGAPRVCPYCSDLIRERDGTIREARSTAGVGQ